MHPLLSIGPFVIPSYGLCMAAGIVLAFMVAYFRYKRAGGTFDSLIMLAAVALAIGLTCAKVAYYAFSYGLVRLFSEILAGDFSGFNNSGIVYYGGLIGGILGAFLIIKVSNLDFNLCANAVIPSIPLGHAVGRIGCLLAGCCYGRHYEGMYAVHSVYLSPSETVFPIQAVESLLNILLFFILVIFTRKERKGFATLSMYLVLYSIIRFVLEFFRGDLIRGIFWGLSSSQWISVLLIAISMVFLVRTYREMNQNTVRGSRL